MNGPIRILQWGMHADIGGVESFIFNLYKHIDRSKVQFDFLVGHNSAIAFEKEIVEMGGKIYRITYSKKESIVKWYTELDGFFREHKELSGIHMHSCFINYSLPLRLAKKYNIPIRVFHSHNSEDMYINKSILKKIYTEIERKRIIDNASDLFACSELAGKYMYRKHKFTWIKNGIDIDRFKFDYNVRNAKRKELGITCNAKVIGFVGRLQYQKNPLFLIDVFYEYNKINRDSVLMIVGTGELSDEMIYRARRLKIEDKILMLGARSDVNELYQAMDLFLLPSRFEGLPVVLVECQAVGVPALVSDNITKQVNVSNMIIYKGIDIEPNEWAEEIRQIFSNEKKEWNNKEVKGKFDIRTVAKEMENFYLERMHNS